MSKLRWNRSDDDDLRGQIAELQSQMSDLQQALQEQARKHDAEIASLSEQQDLIWLLALPPWLRERIEQGRERGWMVVPGRAGIVFHRLADDHQITVPMPLPEDLSRIRSKLSEVQMFEHAA